MITVYYGFWLSSIVSMIACCVEANQNALLVFKALPLLADHPWQKCPHADTDKSDFQLQKTVWTLLQRLHTSDSLIVVFTWQKCRVLCIFQASDFHYNLQNVAGIVWRPFTLLNIGMRIYLAYFSSIVGTGTSLVDIVHDHMVTTIMLPLDK